MCEYNRNYINDVGQCVFAPQSPHCALSAKWVAMHQYTVTEFINFAPQYSGNVLGVVAGVMLIRTSPLISLAPRNPRSPTNRHAALTHCRNLSSFVVRRQLMHRQPLMRGISKTFNKQIWQKSETGRSERGEWGHENREPGTEQWKVKSLRDRWGDYEAAQVKQEAD